MSSPAEQSNLTLADETMLVIPSPAGAPDPQSMLIWQKYD